jgi:flagellar biogenesis protein FliO
MRPAGSSAAALLFVAALTNFIWPGVAMAQHLAQADSPDIAWWRVVGALVFCLLLGVLAAFALRKRLRGGAPVFGAAAKRLRLVESVRLSHRVDVCLVECDDRTYLIATSAQGAVSLAADATRPSSTTPR